MAKKMTIKIPKVENPFKLRRGSWGTTNPVQRVEKSKKAYSRKNKSWKNEY